MQEDCTAKTYNIALIPGDGTGPEVVREGVKVLNTVAVRAGFKLEFTSFDFAAGMPVGTCTGSF